MLPIDWKKLRETITDWWHQFGGWRNPITWMVLAVILFLILRHYRWQLRYWLSTHFHQSLMGIKYFFSGYWFRSGAWLNGEFWFTLTLIVLLFFAARWVFFDARERFQRGWYWAIITFVLPVVGLGFYLFYRNSTLAEFDLAEDEIVYHDEQSWALRDQRERERLARRARLEHMIKVRSSRIREKFPRKYFLPSYWWKLFTHWLDEGDPKKEKYRRQQQFALSIKLHTRPTAKRNKDDLLKKPPPPMRGKMAYYSRMVALANMPFEDTEVGELLSDGKNDDAIALIRERLRIAHDVADSRGEGSYINYLSQLTQAGIIDEESAQQIIASCTEDVITENETTA